MKLEMGHLIDLKSNDEFFQNKIYENEELSDLDLHLLTIKGSVFRHCKFQNVTFEHLNLTKCVFEYCQFVDGSFYESKIVSTKFAHCDFVNMKWVKGKAFQSEFIQILWKYMDFHHFSFELVLFNDCDVIQGEFLECPFRDTQFQISRLYDTFFKSCFFCDVNFTTSTLKDTFLDVNGMKNCILTPSQGLDLLSFYGISFSEQ